MESFYRKALFITQVTTLNVISVSRLLFVNELYLYHKQEGVWVTQSSLAKCNAATQTIKSTNPISHCDILVHNL